MNGKELTCYFVERGRAFFPVLAVAVEDSDFGHFKHRKAKGEAGVSEKFLEIKYLRKRRDERLVLCGKTGLQGDVARILVKPDDFSILSKRVDDDYVKLGIFNIILNFFTKEGKASRLYLKDSFSVKGVGNVSADPFFVAGLVGAKELFHRRVKRAFHIGGNKRGRIFFVFAVHKYLSFQIE